MNHDHSPQLPEIPGTIFSLLKPYRSSLALLIILGLLANVLSLFLPKIIARAIDASGSTHFSLTTIGWEFAGLTLSIFVLTIVQSLYQIITSERVARDVRERIAEQISLQNFAYIQKTSPAKLLTNLTSDVDLIKNFVAQAIVSFVSSLVLIIGASILLIMTNARLAALVLSIIPLIGITFFFVFKKVRALFIKGRGVIDQLNKVINESILGAALIRVLNSKEAEQKKFEEANTAARTIGFSILRLFTGLIPAITLIANLATLGILVLGGHFVIQGTLSLGNFAAFNSYLIILIFPIIIIGFISSSIAQASAAYERIKMILAAPKPLNQGALTDPLTGAIRVDTISLRLDEKDILKPLSFSVTPGTKLAIVGPTGAGKTQLLNLLIGLTAPSQGKILYDEQPLENYDLEALHRCIGLVFQESLLFNASLRENIAFAAEISAEDLNKAIATAELTDFINALPEKLDTIVAERGTSLSGGQKQRIMLARALALNPKILLLDDFTARVDNQTEQKILENIDRNYPDLTIICVTQKVASVKHYDAILFLMDGEIVARGTHQELLEKSPEYVQLSQSQHSTTSYELHA